MCRLFAWHSPTPLTPEEVLGSDQANVIELSRLHRDGWGMAWTDDQGAICNHRDERAAFEVPTIQIAKTTNAILHLRWATEAIPVCIPNTHPFIKSGPNGEIAFIHNGGISRGAVLQSLIDVDLFDSLEGEGDSEQYFAAIISLMRKNGGDIVDAYRRFLKSVQELHYSSLNSFLLTDSHLIIVAAFRPENRPTSQPEDYYDLSWESDSRGITSVWSAGVRSLAGNQVPNYSMILIDRMTGKIATHSLQ